MARKPLVYAVPCLPHILFLRVMLVFFVYSRFERVLTILPILAYDVVSYEIHQSLKTMHMRYGDINTILTIGLYNRHQ